MVQTSRLSLEDLGSDRLGRYYTKSVIGNLLVTQMEGIAPSRVLDLGAGAGSLSRAALARWSDIELVTVDVDASAQTHLSKLFSSSGGSTHNHIQADALSSRLPELISAKVKFIDAAVCNPPFIVPNWRKGFNQIIEDAGFSGCLSVLADVDAALLFLAQNLRLISTHATLGIILPDSLVSATKYKLFRKELLRRYNLHKVIRLPRRSFVNTDAQAYIAVISKGSATTQDIPLIKFNAERTASSQVLVGEDDAIERMDYEYHAQKINCKLQPESYFSLGSIVEEVRRGFLSSAEGRLVGYPVFHTTDMVPDLVGSWCDLSEFGCLKHRGGISVRVVCAEPGDILIARVGRNLEHKILGVTSGYPAITDCVYKLRVPKEFRNRVLNQLSSLQGKRWLASRAYGVSARQLTKSDLLQFPIVI